MSKSWVFGGFWVSWQEFYHYNPTYDTVLECEQVSVTGSKPRAQNTLEQHVWWADVTMLYLSHAVLEVSPLLCFQDNKDDNDDVDTGMNKDEHEQITKLKQRVAGGWKGAVLV